MNFHLFQRRLGWFPTWLGWMVLLFLVIGPVSFWWFRGEAFLAETTRIPAEVLVVEGWIGREGFQAALAEFRQGTYRYLVTSGGVSTNNWDNQRWNYAESARNEFIRLGVPSEVIIAAPAGDNAEQRTYESAVAVARELEARGIHPHALVVFTIGAHARRSRLVYAKASPQSIAVGVISWTPSFLPKGPWWKSSVRAEALLKETVGWCLEILFNSGRSTHSSLPAKPMGLIVDIRKQAGHMKSAA